MTKIKNVLYDYGDKVSFLFDEKEFVGTIEIIDKFGTFFDNSEPHYDIFIQENNIFVKHMPQSSLRKVE